MLRDRRCFDGASVFKRCFLYEYVGLPQHKLAKAVIQEMSAFQIPLWTGLKSSRRRQACSPRAVSATTMQLQDKGGTQNRNEKGFDVLRRSLSISAIMTGTLFVYPARATGLAFKHPLAAALSMLCEVFESILGGMPHAGWHDVVGILLHLVACLLTAAP